MLIDIGKKTPLLSNLLEKMILTSTIQCILGNHESDCVERSNVHYYSNVHLWEHAWDTLHPSES